MRSLAVFLSLLVLCAAVPARRNGGVEVAELSQEEEDCLSRGKFYSEVTEDCHELLGTGPCADDERFVLRKKLPGEDKLILRAVCAKAKCGEGKYWPETDTCVSSADKERLCGNSPKVELTNNYFGEGECSCKMTPPHARLNDSPDNECFELYQRGPCDRGHILAVAEGESVPTCIKDVCHEATLALRRKFQSNRKTTVFFQGGCHELEKSGPPCANNGTLKIQREMQRPGCEKLLFSIFDFGIINECKNEEGCAEQVQAEVPPYTSEQFQEQALAALRKYGRRKVKKNKGIRSSKET